MFLLVASSLQKKYLFRIFLLKTSDLDFEVGLYDFVSQCTIQKIALTLNGHSFRLKDSFHVG